MAPAADLIWPFWSQRRIRRCRAAASVVDWMRSAGSAGVNVIVPSSSCTSANRTSPAQPGSLRLWSSVISTQSPSANRSTESRPSDAGRTPEPAANTSTTGWHTDALSRDHLNVAVPGAAGPCAPRRGRSGSPARGSRPSAAARTGRRSSLTGIVSTVSRAPDGAITSAQPGMSASGVVQADCAGAVDRVQAHLPTRSACARSCPRRSPARPGPGSSMWVTSRCHTSR